MHASIFNIHCTLEKLKYGSQLFSHDQAWKVALSMILTRSTCFPLKTQLFLSFHMFHVIAHYMIFHHPSLILKSPAIVCCKKWSTAHLVKLKLSSSMNTMFVTPALICNRRKKCDVFSSYCR